jgi:hypothetical protein
MAKIKIRAINTIVLDGPKTANPGVEFTCDEKLAADLIEWGVAAPLDAPVPAPAAEAPKE